MFGQLLVPYFQHFRIEKFTGRRFQQRKNQKAYDKVSEHIGLIPLVMISPEDFILIDGGSEERRKLVDGIISQCDRVYLSDNLS